MADNKDERAWVVEPPRAGEIALHLSVGEDVTLTEEQERAISELLHSLETAEVAGYGKCAKVGGSCGTLRCPAMSCSGSFDCGTFKDSKLTASAAGGWSLMGTFGATA